MGEGSDLAKGLALIAGPFLRSKAGGVFTDAQRKKIPALPEGVIHIDHFGRDSGKADYLKNQGIQTF